MDMGTTGIAAAGGLCQPRPAAYAPRRAADGDACHNRHAHGINDQRHAVKHGLAVNIVMLRAKEDVKLRMLLPEPSPLTGGQ